MSDQNSAAGAGGSGGDAEGDPWITGVGMTQFVGESDASLSALLETVAVEAIDDAGVAPDDLDAVIVGNMAAEAFSRRSGLANVLAGSLGAYGASARRVENTSASGASAIESAVRALRAGSADRALVVGAEAMSPASTAESTEIVSRITHDLEYAQGVTLPGFAGLAADTYLERYGAGREDLARIPVKNHRNGAENPYAHFRKRISVEDVLDSPPIASPLRLYDCCPTTDGAAALVLERAPAAPSPDGVRVRRVASAVGTHAVGERPDPLALESVRTAGESAFDADDLSRADVDVLALHDAFSVLEWLELEALGFAEPGRAWEDTVAGDHDVDGALPVNPGGGLKARGHPLGATGVSQVIELVWQLRGDVPNARAVPHPTVGFVLNLAGFGNNAVCTLLSLD